jgi:hypothetical protein
VAQGWRSRLRTYFGVLDDAPARPPSRLRLGPDTDVLDVAQRLMAHEAVVVDLDQLPAETARRAVDVCSGLACGFNGTMKAVGPRSYLLEPADRAVSAVGASRG